MTKAKALVIIFDGVEEIEALAPVDCLRRADVEVTVASAGPNHKVTGRNRIVLVADTSFDSADGSYDVIVIPGGPGHSLLCENEAVLDLLRKQNHKGGLIGSICAGPVVLNQAGVLEGKRFTSFPATGEMLPMRDGSNKVIQDGNLITAQGAGCSISFALKLVEAVCGSDERDNVAKSICF